MARRLISNKIRCKLCDDIVESKHRHDFKVCKCGSVSADGGLSYARRAFPSKLSGTPDCFYEDLSEYTDDAELPVCEPYPTAADIYVEELLRRGDFDVAA